MKKVQSLIQACAETIEYRSFMSAYNNTFEVLRCDSEELKDKAFRLRHRVYCLEYGHECPTETGSYLEQDAYDERSIHYILKHKVSGEIAGTLRVVLPNDERPSESFPMQEHSDHPFLQSDARALTVCEISRFCMAPRFRQRPEDGDYLSSYHKPDTDERKSLKNVILARRRITYPQAALLRGAFEAALEARILDMIWMVEPRHLPSLNAIGFDYRVLGPHIEAHGGLQPMIFNIKHVLDTMQRKAPAIWEIVSDDGRLQDMVDELNHHDWQDRLIDEECWDKIYQKLAF